MIPKVCNNCIVFGVSLYHHYKCSDDMVIGYKKNILNYNNHTLVTKIT